MDKRWKMAGCVVAAIVVIGLLLPATSTVMRQASIDAHPATVFALLNDFRQVDQWAPFTTSDPNARVDYSGAAKGVGAKVSWRGHVIGEGTSTITTSVRDERIVRTTEPGDETDIIQIEPAADGTTTIAWTWRRDFGFNLPGRYLGLMQDNIRGPGIDLMLAGLTEMAEQMPRADFSDLVIDLINIEAIDIAYLTTRSQPDSAAMSLAMNDSFFDILTFIDRHDLAEAGAPLSITRNFSGSELVFDAALPVSGVTDRTPRTENRVKIGKTYEGPVIRVKHTGSYAELGETHDKIAAYLAAQGIERNGEAWESYVRGTDPADESAQVTYIYYPVTNGRL